MRRFQPLMSSLCCLLFVFPFAIPADGDDPFILPGSRPKFRGLTFERWNVLNAEWAIASELGDPSGLRGKVHGIRLLPGAFGGDVEIDVVLHDNMPFVFNSFFVFGEMYDDGSEDNPMDPILPVIFQTTSIETILDGEIVVQGLASDLDEFFFGPIAFDEPIYYTAPQPRGPSLNAIAAKFVLGNGAVYKPLPVGFHTLENTVDSLFFGVIRIKYNIIVINDDDDD